MFLPEDGGAAQARQATGQAWTAEEDLGCLLWLPAVSADEEELLEGETKALGEYGDLGESSQVLECEVFATVSAVLVWGEGGS